MRNANPDDLEHLAGLLCGAGGADGIYADLAAAFDRARHLDVSDELSPLPPLLTWLMDTAGQLRENAAILRGDDPGAAGLVSLPDLLSGAHRTPGAFEVSGQANAEAFLALAREDGDLDAEELDEMRGLLASFADHPGFASYVVGELGPEAFLALSASVAGAADTMDDPAGALALRGLLGTMLTRAFQVPGGAKHAPGTGKYQRWLTETGPGRDYRARLDAFRRAGRQARTEAGDLIADMITAGELSSADLGALHDFLAAQSQDPESNRDLLDGVGTTRLVELSALLGQRMTAGPETTRPDYARLQTGLAGVIAAATRLDRPAPGTEAFTDWKRTAEGRWYTRFMAELDTAGLDTYEVDFAWAPIRGYPLLLSMLNTGDGYSTPFLNDLGTRIRAAEDPARGGDPYFWHLPHDAFSRHGVDPRDYGWFTLDPLAGTLTLMGRHPAAAAEFLDPAGSNDNLGYLIHQRDITLHSPAKPYESSGVPLGIAGFADALEAATTGRIAGSSPDAQGFDRTPAGERVMHDVVEAFSADGGELIAEEGKFVDLRSHLGRMTAAYMEDFQYEISYPLDVMYLGLQGKLPHNFAGLPVEDFLGQVGRDPEANQVITAAQRAYTAVAVDHGVHHVTDPETDVIDRVTIAVTPGAQIAAVMSDAQAVAVYEERIARDEEFNSNVGIAEGFAGLVLDETVGKLAARLPVGGSLIDWTVDELTSAVFEEMKRSSEVEAVHNAEEQYMKGRRETVAATNASIAVALSDYRKETVITVQNSVAERVQSQFDSDRYSYDPRAPEEASGD